MEIIYREFVAIVGLFFIIAFIIPDMKLESYIKRAFHMTVITEILLVIANEGEFFFAATSKPTVWHVFFAVVCYVCRPFLIYFLILLIHRHNRSKYFVKLAMIPALINVGIVTMAFFSDIVFYYDSENVFHRGPLGFTPHITFMAYTVIAMVLIVYDARYKTIRENMLLVAIICYIAMSIYLESRPSSFEKNYLHNAIFMSTVSYFMAFKSYYLMEHLDEEQKQRKRVEEDSRIAIMMSQIQPHFIFNSLNSICYLIRKDPVTAEKALVRFAGYLRRNLNSVQSKGVVSFTSELEHTKAYLYLEELRFGELLHVEYDITCTDFSLPPLSLQPIVENAVRHGVGQKEEGGTVKIAAKKTNQGYILTVSDDGVGFDPSLPIAEDGRTHIGVENVKARLASISKGNLFIESKIGSGTTVTIVLPRGGVKKHEYHSSR